MPFPFIPVGVGVCCLIAVCRSSKRKDYGVMTDERKSIYQAALNGSLKSPQDLRNLSAAFHSQGLFAQSALLEQRAALKERSPEIKAAHDMAFRRALASTNRHVIIEISDAFKSIGATGAAAKLMMRAAGLPEPGEIQEEITPSPVETATTPVEDTSEGETPPTRIGGTITHEVIPTGFDSRDDKRQAIAALPAHAESIDRQLVIVTEGTAA